jgi:serine/threonine-protein kinase
MNTQDRLNELVSLWQRKQAGGENVSAEDLCFDCRELLLELRRRLAALGQMNQMLRRGNEGSTADFKAGDSSPAGPTNRPGAPLPAIPGYDLVAELGHGGMGVVYQARDQKLGRVVALKMILSRHYVSQEALRRFQAEAEAVAQLQHPNIVQLHDHGQHDNLPYFTLEFMAGGSLSVRLKKGGLAPKEAARLVEQLARGMQYAHQAGFIHRDLKPGNILLAADGTPKISDFGLVKRAETDQDLTQTGEAMGTPAYMAPEQALGETKRVGPAADVYSLGAVLYECLTGKPPFQGKSRDDIRHQVIHTDPTPPRQSKPRLPRDLETICLKCLHKDPQKRYASAEALANDLQRFQNHEPIRARPVGRGERLAMWIRRKPATAALLALGLFFGMAVAGAGFWYVQDRADREAADLRQELDMAKEKQKNAEATGRLTAEQANREEKMAAALGRVEALRQNLHTRLSDPLKVQELLSDIDQWGRQIKEARGAWQEAKNLVGSADHSVAATLLGRLAKLNQQLAADEGDYDLARKLDSVRLDAETVVDGKFNPSRARLSYEEVFGKTLHLDLRQGPVRPVAAQVEASVLRYVLVAALDHWAEVTLELNLAGRLLEVTRLADPEPWRDRVRNLDTWKDLAALHQLAKEANPGQQSVAILGLLAQRLEDEGGQAAATVLMRTALLHHPGIFWLNFRLGTRTADLGEQAGCYRAALAIRPGSAAALNNLGYVLYVQKDMAGAIACYKKALECDPMFARAHHNLGTALHAQKDMAGAIASYKKTLEIDPKDAKAHNNLGLALDAQKDVAGAIACYKKLWSATPIMPWPTITWAKLCMTKKTWQGPSPATKRP